MSHFHLTALKTGFSDEREGEIEYESKCVMELSISMC